MITQTAPLLLRVSRVTQCISVAGVTDAIWEGSRGAMPWRRWRERALTLTSSLLFLSLSLSCLIASSMLSLIFFAFASR